MVNFPIKNAEFPSEAKFTIITGDFEVKDGAAISNSALLTNNGMIYIHKDGKFNNQVTDTNVKAGISGNLANGGMIINRGNLRNHSGAQI